MKILFLLFIITIASISLKASDTTLIIEADILNDYLPIYSDELGIKKIGEIEKKNNVYLIGPGTQSYFLVYGNGLKGYASKSFIYFNKYQVRGLTSDSIDWKVNVASKMQKSFTDILMRQRGKDSTILTQQEQPPNFCDYIIEKKDDFEDEIILTTPLLVGGQHYDISFSRIIKKNSESYFLRLLARGSEVSFLAKGVYIILAGGKRIVLKEQRIDTEYVGDGDYLYSCFIRISQSDLELFKKNEIVKWKLYIFENQQQDVSMEIKSMLNCISNRHPKPKANQPVTKPKVVLPKKTIKTINS